MARKYIGRDRGVAVENCAAEFCGVEAVFQIFGPLFKSAVRAANDTSLDRLAGLNVLDIMKPVSGHPCPPAYIYAVIRTLRPT